MQNEPDEFVPAKMFMDVIGLQFWWITELLVMNLALQKVLHQKALVSPEELDLATDSVKGMKQIQAMKKAIEDTPDSESIEDLLKNFEGPLQ